MVFGRKCEQSSTCMFCDTASAFPAAEFESYSKNLYQLSGHQSGPGPGPGLGLAIVGRTAELLGLRVIRPRSSGFLSGRVRCLAFGAHRHPANSIRKNGTSAVSAHRIPIRDGASFIVVIVTTRRSSGLCDRKAIFKSLALVTLMAGSQRVAEVRGP